MRHYLSLLLAFGLALNPMFVHAQDVATEDLPAKQVLLVTSDNPELVPNKFYVFEEGEMRGLKDKLGHIIFPAKYLGFNAIIQGFEPNEHRLIVVTSTGMALADTKGRLITQPKYGFIGNGFSKEGITSFSYDNLIDEEADNKLGFMNLDGKEIIPPIYDSVGTFVDGYAWVVRGEREQMIDLSGKITWELPVGWHTYHDNYAKERVVVQNAEGQYALFTVHGQEIIPFGRYRYLETHTPLVPYYDWLRTENEGGFGLVQLTTGKEILSNRYNQPIDIFNDNTLGAQADGKVYEFDAMGQQTAVHSAKFAKQCRHIRLGASHKKRKQYFVRSFDSDSDTVEFMKGERPGINGVWESDSTLQGHCADVTNTK